MKETISNLRKLIISNNIKAALEQLLDICETNNQYEHAIDEIIILQSTNSTLLDNEKGNSHLPEYKLLIKNVLAILSYFKTDVKPNPVFTQSENVGRNIKIIKPDIQEDDNTPKLAYLSPNPIDKKFGFNFDLINKYFRTDKVHIDCFYLNMETLQNLEGYDYVVIRSEIFKEKIYIEGENLQSQMISLADLQDNILSAVKCLILIAEGNVDLQDVTIPFIQINNTKAIDNFIFKFFRLDDATKIEGKDYIILNKDNIQTLKLEKGKPVINYPSCELPNELDKKILQSFVGRTLDQEKLIAKIIQLPYSGKVITVKGAGGVGKTTTVSKVVIELRQRNFYTKGIGFIACEHITDYKSLEAKMAICFDFDNIINFTEHIRQYDRFDKLIILDNFETLLNLDSQEEIAQIKQLVSLVSDYASIVLTSREIIGFEFEDVLALDRLPTDDALTLFLQTAGIDKITPDEKKILREDIIENLLANNPLAIKIIASPTVLPKGKSMEKLKEELEKDFFSTTSSEIQDIFKNDADTNIERKRSVYQSINYSYTKLNPTDKLALELLHLFPDGINMSHFEKCFNQTKSETSIKERNLASLETKSLIELSHGIAKLQSIIGRFAAHQFVQRDTKQKTGYYNDAYNYNAFIMDAVDEISTRKSYDVALAITDNQINNLLFALSYMPNLKYKTDDKKVLLNYICDIIYYITTESSIKKYTETLKNINSYFEDIPKAKLLLQIVELYLLYYERIFDATYQKLNEILPFEQINNLNFQDEIEIRYILRALRIYSYEGFTLECLKIYHLNHLYKWGLGSMLFYIGSYGYSKRDNFYKFETLLNEQKLSIMEIESYLPKIYPRNHLDKMQISYTLSKMKTLQWAYIEKLVITNPYTKGLKNLMFAFNTPKEEDKIGYYETAIKHLEHIKYYFIEAIYYYAKYLQEIKHPDYLLQFEKGFHLAERYQYRFLKHQFIQLKNGTNEVYNSDNYPLVVDFDFEDFMAKYAEAWKDEKEEDKPNAKSKPIALPIVNKPAQKPVLFVEGPTDKTALLAAIKIFQPDLSSKFEIICELDERFHMPDSDAKGGGYNWVKKRMKGWISNNWKVKAACLFDMDEDAIKAKHEILKHIEGINNDSRALYRVFQLDKPSHILPMQKKKIIIPFALEEMFPISCWQYAENKGWLMDRLGLETIIQKASNYEAKTQTVIDYLREENLAENLHLTKQVNKFKKQNFIDYILELPENDKKIIFKEFKPLIDNLTKFYK